MLQKAKFIRAIILQILNIYFEFCAEGRMFIVFPDSRKGWDVGKVQ